MIHERRNAIVKILQSERTLKVTDLIERFSVSNETIRRDLEALEQQGYLQRVYGGAVAKSMNAQEPDYASRETKNYIEKLCIARKAVELIEDGDTLALDLGTSVLEFARALKGRKKVLIITNFLPVAMELNSDPGIRVIIIGGNLRIGEYSTSGFLAEEAISYFNVDKLILGVGGLTPQDGVTDYNIEEASLRRCMVNHSREVVALADHSKLGVTALNSVCPTSRLNYLITDERADPKIISEIKGMGVTVIHASDN